MVPEDVRARGAARRRPYVSRGGIKLANALDALGVDVSGSPGARRRGLDGRLHRLPAAARGARTWSRSTSPTASSTGGCAQDPTRDRDRAPQRPRAASPTSFRTLPDLIVIDVSFISLMKVLAAGARVRGRARSTAWRWSSRSSRSVVRRSARAASSATRRLRRGALVDGRGGGASGLARRAAGLRQLGAAGAEGQPRDVRVDRRGRRAGGVGRPRGRRAEVEP